MSLPQTGAIRLVTSSKALAVLGAMLGVLVLLALKIDPAPFVDFVKWAVPAYVLAVSAEDAASSLAKRPHAPAQTNTTIFPPAPPAAAPMVDRERITPADGFAPARVPRDVQEIDELELQSLRPSSSVRRP